jgi:hypothetical protein
MNIAGLTILIRNFNGRYILLIYNLLIITVNFIELIVGIENDAVSNCKMLLWCGCYSTVRSCLNIPFVFLEPLKAPVPELRPEPLLPAIRIDEQEGDVPLRPAPPLRIEQAAKRLSDLGYGTVYVREGDGYFGWPDAAPFDGIVVTAAAPQIPPPLLKKLKPGGRMLIPIGAAFLTQQLMLIEKLADGTIRTEALLPVAFVPLTRGR